VLAVDAPDGANRGVYRVGRDLAADKLVTGGWSDWLDVPDWFSWRTRAQVWPSMAPTAATSSSCSAWTPPRARTRPSTRSLPGLLPDGGGGSRGPLLGIPGWFSWDNTSAGIAVARIDGRRQLVVLMVNVTVGTKQGWYRLVDLDEEPAVHGAWEVTLAHSGVLAIHAALLPTGKVLFFAGSGNNQVRSDSLDYGDVGKGVATSAIWESKGER
jgi:hypothetical protein